MRKKMIAVATAAALTLSAAPAVHAETATNSKGADTAIGRGIENAFDPDKASSMKEKSVKGFFDMAVNPYRLMSSDNKELSSQGVTQAIINYVIIAVAVTVIGQIIQLIMSNLSR